jgi:hypothetical protein
VHSNHQPDESDLTQPNPMSRVGFLWVDEMGWILILYKLGLVLVWVGKIFNPTNSTQPTLMIV